jgi:hypothetical protein
VLSLLFNLFDTSGCVSSAKKKGGFYFIFIIIVLCTSLIHFPCYLAIIAVTRTTNLQFLFIYEYLAVEKLLKDSTGKYATGDEIGLVSFC